MKAILPATMKIELRRISHNARLSQETHDQSTVQREGEGVRARQISNSINPQRAISMNATKTAKVFGCTEAQAVTQMRRNLAQTEAMAKQARSTGKLVNGYTADELEHSARKIRKGWNLA